MFTSTIPPVLPHSHQGNHHANLFDTHHRNRQEFRQDNHQGNLFVILLHNQHEDLPRSRQCSRFAVLLHSLRGYHRRNQPLRPLSGLHNLRGGLRDSHHRNPLLDRLCNLLDSPSLGRRINQLLSLIGLHHRSPSDILQFSHQYSLRCNHRNPRHSRHHVHPLNLVIILRERQVDNRSSSLRAIPVIFPQNSHSIDQLLYPLYFLPDSLVDFQAINLV